MSSRVQARASSSKDTTARGMHADTLDKYDDLHEPIPTEEQERLLRELKTRNDASNYIYRAALLFIPLRHAVPPFLRHMCLLW